MNHTVAGPTSEELRARLRDYLERMGTALRQGLDHTAQLHAHAAQAVAAALAVLPSEEPAGTWAAPTTTQPPYLHMGAEEGTP